MHHIEGGSKLLTNSSEVFRMRPKPLKMRTRACKAGEIIKKFRAICATFYVVRQLTVLLDLHQNNNKIFKKCKNTKGRLRLARHQNNFKSEFRKKRRKNSLSSFLLLLVFLVSTYEQRMAYGIWETQCYLMIFLAYILYCFTSIVHILSR